MSRHKGTSIRTALFAQIGLLVVALALVVYAANSRFLEGFYLQRKKALLKEQADQVSQLSESLKYSDIEAELRQIETVVGGAMLIKSQDGYIKYSSSPRFIEQRFHFPPGHPTPYEPNGPQPWPEILTERPATAPVPAREEPVISKAQQESQDGFTVRPDIDSPFRILVYTTVLANGDLLEFQVPLASISEAVSVSNTFLVYVSVFLLVLAAVMAYVLSRSFTKPLLQINRVAERMAHLDFTERCSTYPMNEIGELGQSVNYLSEQLHQALEELRQKNAKLQEDIETERRNEEMRREFIAGVSHELKTPLALISGYAEALELGLADDEQTRSHYCSVITDEVRKMSHLVTELLDLAQIESGSMKLNPTRFDLAALVRTVAEKLSAIAEDEGIELQVEAESPVMVYADPFRVEQILHNYLSNALRYVDSSRLVRVSCAAEKSVARVSVMNTGEHIPDVERSRIWESFYRTDQSRTRATGGYGLGLAIVSAIQKCHGCRYGVDNVDGGVSFWFEEKLAGDEDQPSDGPAN